MFEEFKDSKEKFEKNFKNEKKKIKKKNKERNNESKVNSNRKTKTRPQKQGRRNLPLNLRDVQAVVMAWV